MLNKFPPPPKYNKIYGTDQDDQLFGTAGADIIYAGDGKDYLIGGAGADWFYGGKGDDNYYVQDTGDVVVEYADEGNDAVYSYVTSYTLGSNVEELNLMGDAINGTGNSLNNYLAGNDKNNTLIGLDGNDFLDGGKGADIMVGGHGDDEYRVDNAGDIVWELADDGIDVVTSTINYTLGDTVEKLFLGLDGGAINGTGNGQDNTIRGNASDNVLKGEGGEDIINGFGGKDKMYGGAGDDYIVVDSSDDIVVEYANEGYDTVLAKTSYVTPLHVEFMIMDGLDAVIALGNSQDNNILGSAADNLMFGYNGKDILHGAIGNDTIDGGSGNDDIFGGSDADTLFGGTGDDRIFGGFDTDTLTGGADNDTFLFKQDGGHDTVTDFKANGDLDIIEAGVFADFASVLAHTQQVGNDTVITFDAATSMTLQNFDMSNLQASDFQFI